LPEAAQLGGGLTPVEVRILPPPLVYPRLKLSHGLHRAAERRSSRKHRGIEGYEEGQGW
jgi:hypothetical protein